MHIRSETNVDKNVFSESHHKTQAGVRWGGSLNCSPPSVCPWPGGKEPVTTNKTLRLCTTAAPISTARALVIGD